MNLYKLSIGRQLGRTEGVIGQIDHEAMVTIVSTTLLLVF